jgi:hypothetical protein
MSPEQLNRLLAVARSQEHLRRLTDAIEQHHRLVFHSATDADWKLVRRSAEQILVAEIVTRHRGNADGVYFALRALESAGQPWDEAIHALAGTIHSYYTTPLGIVLRSDLFGEEAVFIMPEAVDWIRQRRAAPAGRAGSPS